MPAERLRSIDQHHRVKLGGIGGFEQEGNVTDDDVVPPLSGLQPTADGDAGAPAG